MCLPAWTYLTSFCPLPAPHYNIKTFQQVVSLFDPFDLECLMGLNNIYVGVALELLKEFAVSTGDSWATEASNECDVIRPSGFEPHILARPTQFSAYIFKTEDDPKTEALPRLNCTCLMICGFMFHLEDTSRPRIWASWHACTIGWSKISTFARYYLQQKWYWQGFKTF